MAEDLTMKNMIESGELPEAPTLDTLDDVAESSQTEDADENPDLQAIPQCSGLAAEQEPLLCAGRNRSKKRVTQSSKGAGRQKNKPRAGASKAPTSSLSLLIYTAISRYQKKAGLSIQSLKKIMQNKGYDMAKKKHYFLRALKNMVAKGQIWQIKGTGATGSFKINSDIEKKPRKKKGKCRKTRSSTKNKKKAPKKGREAAKEQVKASVKQTCKKSSVQAGPSQVNA